ncbi:UBC-like protein [Macrolepiota fuliginosa MF-IS2]|uniref:UBC-like protein n=1 Tax=Macrolepiota fuliginosa MF-IS2 TaxID=1400762 RepID=A0A9P5XBI8_9AGAR|nr:UBC-like protein [Macrolepiota fuliginosa MF-IS2]
MPALNKNNSAVKRIMQEARELANDPSTDYTASPLEDDIFEWHCTLRGSPGTEFEGGLYHFRILLPAEYPFRPPSIMMLTPSGRFELNTKICISFTNYHEELWQPAWGVRTAIIGLQGFFPLKGQAAVGVGSIEYPAAERRRLAVLSREWICPHCERSNLDLLPDVHAAPSGQSEEQPPTDETLHTSVAPSPDPIPEEVAEERLVAAPKASARRPPVVLDGAICVVFVLLFALLCRRVF